MMMNKKGMTLIFLILGVVIVSGCSGPNMQQMVQINEARELFNKATVAGAKKCAPCEYAKAEAYLSLVNHYVEIKHGCSPYLDKQVNSINIVKEKSLEALKVTPCEVKTPALPGPTPPAPTPPKPPAPPAPAPTPAPMPGPTPGPTPATTHPDRHPDRHLRRLQRPERLCLIPSILMWPNQTSIPREPKPWTAMACY